MLKFHNFNRIGDLDTPFWYYDMSLLRRTVSEVASLSEKYGIGVHYAIKANAEPRIVECISAAGLGADCVSGNEVAFAVSHGFRPESVVFAGVGKTDKEINMAMDLGIGAFHAESMMELAVLEKFAAARGMKVNVAVRINPNIDAHTHKYVTTGLDDNKFGIQAHEFDAVIEILKKSMFLNFTGLHFHIGSQITDVRGVYSEECRRAGEIVSRFESCGLAVRDIDLGGGLGVDYEDPDGAPVPDFGTWFATIDACLSRRADQNVSVEPGRALVAQCGSLISRVLFVKHGEHKNFLILDAGMNDLIRPALYGAYHKLENLTAEHDDSGRCSSDDCEKYDVVGPVCESSDVWGEGRSLPTSCRGDLIAVRSAGAYGSVMSSRYNLRDLAGACFSDDL